jgi:hypothetical protein
MDQSVEETIEGYELSQPNAYPRIEPDGAHDREKEANLLREGSAPRADSDGEV